MGNSIPYTTKGRTEANRHKEAIAQKKHEMRIAKAKKKAEAAQEAAKAKLDHTLAMKKQNDSVQAEREKLEAQKEEANAKLALEMEKLKVEREKAAQEAKERERQDKHEKFMKELERKQKREQIALTKERLQSIKDDITTLDDKIKDTAAQLGDAKMDLEKQIKEQEQQQDKINGFASVKEDALAKKDFELQLSKAKREFNEADDQIKAAINKTGQVEANVGKFLILTHGLLGGTLITTANATKLSVQLATFGEMVSKECQDELTVQQYFGARNLKKFIPILAKADFQNVESLTCKDEAEYEEILEIIEQGVKILMDEKEDPEDALRKLWDIGTKVQIYSASNECWMDGEIANISGEADDELIHVKYGNQTKQVGRYSDMVRAAADADAKSEEEAEVDGKALFVEWKLAKKYWAKMEEQGLEEVDDWQDIDDEVLDDMGFTAVHKKKFYRLYKAYLSDKSGKKKSVLSKREQRELKRICMEPDTWRKYAELQQKAVREGLGEICPLMSEFFKRMHQGLKQCGQMLSFDENLNADQMKAIEQISSAPPRSIEYKIDEEENKDEDEKDEEEKEQGTAEGPEDVDDDAKEEPRHNRMRTSNWIMSKFQRRQSTKDILEQKEEKIEKEQSEKPRKTQSVEAQDDVEDPEEAMHKEWNIGTKVQIYSISNKRWMDGEIVSVTDDDEGEWLDVKYGNRTKQVGRYSDVVRAVMNAENKVALQSRQLTAAAIVSIDVTKSMMEEFSQNVLTERALAVATGVEDSSMQVVKSQGAIRQSLLMAQEILKLRPAVISDEGKKLWDAVDDGIVRIMKNALKMVAVSSEYFAYFLKFQQGFKYYQSNSDKPLMIGLKFLHQDIEQFNAFKDKFAKTVQELSDEAMDCIKKCVSSTIGAENFEKFRNSRQDRLNVYMGKKREYDAEAKRLDDELEKLKNEQVENSGTRVKLEAVVQNLKNVIKSNQNQKEKCLQIKNELEQMLTKLVAE